MAPRDIRRHFLSEAQVLAVPGGRIATRFVFDKTIAMTLLYRIAFNRPSIYQPPPS
jgi:hypothetical protein